MPAESVVQTVYRRIVVKRLLISIFLSIFMSTVSFSATYQAVILKVSDGDTVWVKIYRALPEGMMHGRRVKLRLLGIDTPEEYPSRKMDKDIEMCHTTFKQMRKLGLLATKHAKTMLYKGERVTVVTKGRGYYGRTLVFIILPDGTNYNEKEVADGYACVYKWHGRKSRELSEEEFEKLERLMERAQEEGKGLWGEYRGIMECLCE